MFKVFDYIKQDVKSQTTLDVLESVKKRNFMRFDAENNLKGSLDQGYFELVQILNEIIFECNLVVLERVLTFLWVLKIDRLSQIIELHLLDLILQ